MLQDVNTTDIRSAIELGCQTMGSVFNRDDGDIPFMGTRVWPTARFEYSINHAESHIPGRHLNALLAAEALAGVGLDEAVIEKHAAAAFYSFGGAIPLPLNRAAEDGRPVGEPVRFLDHNIREGLHALYALAHYRQNERADRLMREAIGFITENFAPQMAWSEAALNRPGLTPVLQPFIAGTARAIGPLVKYYRASGYAPALSLAVSLAQQALAHFPADGGFDLEQMGTNHAHSITCTLSSLAQLARATRDGALMERVRAFYDSGLWALRNELGWAAEIVAGKDPARGEVNTSGDILETALILGAHYGPRYYEDAERILRGHILPSQLRDTGFIQDPPNPGGEDALRDVARRHLGAFGFPAPYGHHPLGVGLVSFNMDIVGGAVGSLCEAYAACASFEGGCHRVNLLFDHATEHIRVASPYTHGALEVTVHRPAPLFVRIPSWVNRAGLRVSGAEGRPAGDWLFVPQPRADVPVRIVFALEEREIALRHHTSSLRTRLRGDSVAAMENEGMPETFFPGF